MSRWQECFNGVQSRVTRQWPGVKIAVLDDLRNRSHQNGSEWTRSYQREVRLDPAKEVKPTEPAGGVKGVWLSAVSLMRQHVETLIMYNVYLRFLLPCYTHRGPNRQAHRLPAMPDGHTRSLA